ncbi:hypothetical protein H5V45_09500 [Nocardioides sp. KIGAM211]|uniref:Uncharacterized protein n=1 Tax=Nocardioides luti TaxID=2761101 RepID=A0A7X0RG27_9ACTN|nr:hypothetical protein [Nocardioides luti]
MDVSAAANYCGRLFADLGADVILVGSEPSSALRDVPPLSTVTLTRSPRAANNTSKLNLSLFGSAPSGDKLGPPTVEIMRTED